MTFHNHLYIDGHLSCLPIFLLFLFILQTLQWTLDGAKKCNEVKQEMRTEPWRGRGVVWLEKKHNFMVKIISNTSIITKTDNKRLLKKPFWSILFCLIRCHVRNAQNHVWCSVRAQYIFIIWINEQLHTEAETGRKRAFCVVLFSSWNERKGY